MEIEMTRKQKRDCAIRKINAGCYTLGETDMSAICRDEESFIRARSWFRFLKRGVQEMEALFDDASAELSKKETAK